MNCTICNRKAFESYSLIQHIKIYHPFEQTYSCGFNDCFRKFTSLSSLKKHFNNAKCHHFQNQHSNTALNNISESQCSQRYPTLDVSFSSLDHGDNTNTIQNFEENKFSTKCIDDSILMFIGKLYSNPSISRIVVQSVIEHSSELVDDILFHVKSTLDTIIPSTSHTEIKSLLNINPFQNMLTEYKRFQYLDSSKTLLRPESFFIGEMINSVKQNFVNVADVVIAEGQFVPMRNTLKSFLELPDTLNVIFKHISEEEQVSGMVITNIFSTDSWKNMKKAFNGECVLPLVLYYDEFEIGNPLGSRAGVHKVGAMYFTVHGIPPMYSSCIENIFLVQLLYSTDRTTFGNKAAFKKIIEELLYLEKSGISINANSQIYKIKFVLLALIGDNLAVNALTGFAESFSANFFCRRCYSSKEDTRMHCEEVKATLRNIDNYTLHSTNNDFGIKETCIFNDLTYFHNTVNVMFDVMHDLYEGVCRYDMAKIIQSLIVNKSFSLERLNLRIKYFNHDSNIDVGNSILPIIEKHLKQGCLIMSASEMSTLVTYFGIIVGDLVPEDDQSWNLYLLLFEILHIVLSYSISYEELHYLKCIIKEHHELYLHLFNEHLKPKYHFVLHYPSVIRDFGSLRYYSCIRYESFHKLSKTYAHIVSSRRNIIMTLALKLQFKFCYRLISRKGLIDRIESGKCLGLVSEITELQKKLKSCPNMNNSSYVYVSWVKINGILFKAGLGFYYKTDMQDDPVFSLIKYVLVDEQCNYYLVHIPFRTIGLRSHIIAYEIEYKRLQSLIVSKLNLEDLVVPRTLHIMSDDGSLVISTTVI